MDWPKLIVCVLICQVIGFAGNIATIPALSWYSTIQKPFFTPPDWIFIPVWTLLYTLMGISLYWVWERGLNRTALSLFVIQLILNGIWSNLFFGLKNIFYSLVEIFILWFAILLTIISFYRIDRKAGLILIPYLIWVSTAIILNYYIWILNA